MDTTTDEIYLCHVEETIRVYKSTLEQSESEIQAKQTLIECIDEHIKNVQEMVNKRLELYSGYSPMYEQALIKELEFKKKIIENA